MPRLGVDPAALRFNRPIATANGSGNAAGLVPQEVRLGSFVLLIGRKAPFQPHLPLGSRIASATKVWNCSGVTPGGRPPMTIGSRCSGSPLEVMLSAPIADSAPARRLAMISRPRPVSRLATSAATALER